jgi:histidine triad (HIT) family protein
MEDPGRAGCIFCKIVRGELPLHKVYEDDSYLAFLDIRPVSPGHTLVIPKAHYRWVWDTPETGNYFEVAKKIAQALQKVSGVEEVHAKVVGEEVPHAHIWVYPAPDKAMGDKSDLVGNAAKLREALS